MTLLESYNDIKQSSNLFDTRMQKTSAYLKAVMNEHAINLEESELKVMKESGTIEDLVYLQEEATDGMVGKIREAIKAIIKAFKDFCTDVKNKILTTLSKKEVSDSIQKMEKKVKLNPFISKKKIKYSDVEKEIKLCDEFQSKVKRLFAKLKHGQGDVKDVKTLENDYEATRKKVLAASMITLTVSSAILLLKKYKNELGSRFVKGEEEGSKILEAAMSGFDEDTKESSSAAYSAAARFSAKISKDKQNAIVDGFGNIWSSLKDAVMKLKGNTPNDIMEGTEEVVQEEDKDVAYLESLRAELFGENTENSSDEEFDPDSYTKEYMQSLEDEVFGNINESSDEEPVSESTEDDDINKDIIEDFLKDF